jgi:hypothetical protein
MQFKNYSNPYATAAAPTRANENQFVPLENVDTPDFSVSVSDTTALVCNNPGVWNIVLQYQLVGRRPTEVALDATLVGWFNINGKDVQNSAATQYAARPGANNVLVVSLTSELNAGDEVRSGVRSVSSDGELNVDIRGYQTPAGVYAPSLIITANKLSA